MGAPGQSFADLHRDKINEIKRNLMDYVKGIRQAVQDSAGRPSSPPPNNIEVSITDNGYPVLPSCLHQDNLSKGILTQILRAYLNAHYSEYNKINRVLTITLKLQ